MNSCLYCYQPLSGHEKLFHRVCSHAIFGTIKPPQFLFDRNSAPTLAKQLLQKSISLTGVQPKLHFDHFIEQKATNAGNSYILKFSSKRFPHIPEVEDLTMHLASIAKIPVVPHTLVRLNSGDLAYLTQRIDRKGQKKIHMEDMCQLSGRSSHDKYLGSYEQIARIIQKYSAKPSTDIVRFFDQLIFAFLTGNADMHLKNISLLFTSAGKYRLTPAYDMVSTTLVYPIDDEDLALSLNGKRKKINKNDFVRAMNASNIDKAVQEKLFNKMQNTVPLWNEFIDSSFLNRKSKKEYKDLIRSKIDQFR